MTAPEPESTRRFRLDRASEPLTPEQEAKLAEPLIRANDRTLRLMSERLQRQLDAMKEEPR